MTEETFVRELERRADDVHGVPLSFHTVRGRAHRIRRRRRAAAAVGVAAAVAAVVMVPAALTGGGSDKAPEPAPVPTDTPGASVLHDGVVTLPDGQTVPLDVDNADVSQLVVLTDGRIVLAMMQPSPIRVYAPDGTLEARYPAQSNAITASAQDDAVAWVAKDFTVRVLSSGVAEPAELPGIPMPGESPGSIDAVIDAEHLLVGDWNTTTGELTPQGYEELTTGEPFRVSDVSPDGELWAVQYADDADPQFGCSGLYDPDPAQMVARGCGTANLRFSPDGQHLFGLAGDNNMWGIGATYDLDLQEVGRYESAGNGDVLSRAAWADATHLLVARTNWKTSRWSLERVGLAWGDAAVVVPEEPGRNPEIVQEFLLSE
ncbi:hypothetical protein [Nocardioides sp. YIM 152315]|uniref:hypothetical protein n=1 Tax=Nocardioides sp. YIM 152315 TaxID=3031760 RepID=UPI0023DA51BD|nr:hypothetical protein [Nocardioides sp. YIM 152315]MDF1604008.1 hypothetical protein [Nocardioides sp. YIM 152315]